MAWWVDLFNWVDFSAFYYVFLNWQILQDEELLASTSSERLTLDEEYAMQETWRVDSTKLTFIILHRPTYEQSGGNEVFSSLT